jgi:hypothetical protein
MEQHDISSATGARWKSTSYTLMCALWVGGYILPISLSLRGLPAELEEADPDLPRSVHVPGH